MESKTLSREESVKVIAFDVDLVVFEDVYTDWIFQTIDKHIKAGGLRFEKGVKLYNEILDTTEYYVQPIFEKYGIENSEIWWTFPDIYDKAQPRLQCKNLIDGLSEEYDVIFVSACKDENIAQKRKRLKHFFPDIPLIVCNDKHFVDADLLIDDSPKKCESFARYRPKSITIYYTGVQRNLDDVIGCRNVHRTYDWDEVGELIDKWRKVHASI